MFGPFKWKIHKNNYGAVWFAFANFTSFLLCLLVLIANRFEGTSIFSITYLDLHGKLADTTGQSGEIYTARNYTAYNPYTNNTEEPRYLFLSYSGLCHVFENKETQGIQYSKQCEQRFVQHFFLPEGTLEKKNGGETRSTETLNIDHALVNRMMTAAAALTILTMIFNVVNIAVTVAGQYGFAFRWHWPFAVVLPIPVVILVWVATSFLYGNLNSAQYPRHGSSYVNTPPGLCLGLTFLFLGMMLTFIANPIMFLALIYFIFFLIVLILSLIGCLGRGGGSSDRKNEGCPVDCHYHYQPTVCPTHHV